VRKIGCDTVRPETHLLHLGAQVTFVIPDQDSATPGGLSRLDIRQPVTNHEGFSKVDIKLLGGLK